MKKLKRTIRKRRRSFPPQCDVKASHIVADPLARLAERTTHEKYAPIPLFLREGFPEDGEGELPQWSPDEFGELDGDERSTKVADSELLPPQVIGSTARRVRMVRKYSADEILNIGNKIRRQFLPCIENADEISLVDELLGECCFLPASLEFHARCDFGLFYHVCGVANLVQEHLPNNCSTHMRRTALLVSLLHDANKWLIYTARCGTCKREHHPAGESFLEFVRLHGACSDKGFQIRYNKERQDASGIQFIPMWKRLAMAPAFVNERLLKVEDKELESICTKIEEADIVCSRYEEIFVCERFMEKSCTLCTLVK